MEVVVFRGWPRGRILACLWLLLIVPLGGCGRLRQIARLGSRRSIGSADAQLQATGNSPAVVQPPAVGEIPNEDPDKIVRLAEKAFEQRNHRAAAQYVAKALELDPEHAGAWLLKGKLAETVGDDDRALESFLRAISCGNENPEAALCVARLQLAEGQAAQTSPLLRAVIDSPRATEAQRTEASWLLGMAYTRTKRWSQAVSALSEAALNRKMSADDWYWLALSRYQSGDLAGARSDILRVRELQPQHRGAAMLLSELDRSQQTDGRVLPARGTAAP